MPVTTSYPNNFGNGNVFLDTGWLVEVHQAYAIVPTTPTASVPLLDVTTGNQLLIAATATRPRVFMSCKGVIVSPTGFDVPITLASAGTLKVATALSVGATLDASGVANAAVPRTAAGVVITGTSIPSGSVFLHGSTLSNIHATGSNITSNTTYSLFGASAETTGSTAINFSSGNVKAPVVLMTFKSLVQGYRQQNIADYPDLPLAVLRHLQNAL